MTYRVSLLLNLRFRLIHELNYFMQSLRREIVIKIMNNGTRKEKNNMKKLNEMMSKLKTLQVKENQLMWTQFTVGYDFGMQEAQNEVINFLKDDSHYQIVLDAEKEAQSEGDKRICQICKQTFEPYHQSEEVNQLIQAINDKTNELMKVINAFRFNIDGRQVTSVDIAQILMNSEDREERKKAYLARNQVNQPLYETGFLELIQLRKQLATLTGYDNFVDYKLHQEELDKNLFSDWKDQIQKVLPEIKKTRKSYGLKYLGDENVYPWDESYISGKIAPSLNTVVDMTKYYEVVKTQYQKFGFNLDDYGIVYDVFSRKNKSEWGYFFAIEEGKDSRILANVKDRYHEFNVLMHESGHAVHSSLKNVDEFILNRGVSGIITEGIANLFGSLIYDESFYQMFFEDKLEKVSEEFKAYSKWSKINAFRQVGLIMFDQNLYKRDLESLEDIHQLYWDTFKDYFDEELGDYMPPWAFKIHHTSHPIYLHNYFMGDVTCEMLRSVYKTQTGHQSITEDPADFGQFLYEKVIAPSGRYTYSELFEKISGKAFSLDYML